MPNYICDTCGSQFAASEQPPARCPICDEERQYVNPTGQTWTTLAALQQQHHNVLHSLEPGLWQITAEPKFGIGQRALLVQAPSGNVLWDCISLVDEATVAAIQALGGISALAMSHPHMFGSMVEWSHAFGHAPIYLQAEYRAWAQRPDPVIQFWEGDACPLREGVTLYRCGGHFDGSTVLHWPAGATGRGVLLSSDTMFVAPDRRHVGFMRSYPNYIPLSASKVDDILARIEPLAFDHIYGNFATLEIVSDAKGAVQRSAVRHKRAIGLR
ncbi:MAG: MBL fold metallo-hydrolase [Anaerolineae bacterium]|nr:MBL fold metallo-hydrolase [Anaerolineae bacterium]